MKFVKLALLFTAITCLIISCKKNMEEAEETCEDANTTQVTYTNTGTVPLKVVTAYSLNSQYEPVNPIHSIELAPGASVVKEFTAGKYWNVWYKNCSTTCTRAIFNTKMYDACAENEEKYGL